MHSVTRLILILSLALPILSQFYFLTPAKDTQYTLNQPLNITWKGPAESISLAISQNQPKDEPEYIFSLSALPFEKPDQHVLGNVTGLTFFPWTVQTRKNLSHSPVFCFNIFAGKPAPVASSHWFNISGSSRDTAVPVTPTSTITTTTLTTTTTTTTTTKPIPTNGSKPGPETLGIGGKVALGIGIPLAVAAGILASVLRTRRRETNTDDSWSSTD
ncbi:hypothetical protein BDV25DRAFT_144685 [Aspergillus avenaceus]|uniref:Ser-Thr-rich glycosyl-phosphatidyl-inositol-anchored membrane family-domain-containing protein n=1 Tax=Aspergillus avenaceus TaxID=36643 RepID=A0A5N6TG99_ASPAV|nr:hypothetical protein BDV25DRAFT_144685 [Aspergillus avenaceus]